MSESKCPKCGAEANSIPHAIFGCTTFKCGSFFDGDEEFAAMLRIEAAMQTEACRIRELEAENAKLREEVSNWKNGSDAEAHLGDEA